MPHPWQAGKGKPCVPRHPIDAVEWVPRERLHANAYNPNHVFPPELTLLKISILESGWTQPIVAREDDEIVDGFHRWLIASDIEIAALTDPPGLVPVVRLKAVTAQEQIMATIRHNRARGTHHVLKMSDIVNTLLMQHDMSLGEIAHLLQMEPEEVGRLHERGDVRRRAGKEFSKGWVPQ